MPLKTIHIQYYALLREESGVSKEDVSTSALTAAELYQELKNKYNFKLSMGLFKVAINNQFSDWATKLNDGDSVVFIPPVAGG